VWVGDILVDGVKPSGDSFDREYLILGFKDDGYVNVKCRKPHSQFGCMKIDWSTFTIIETARDRRTEHEFDMLFMRT
jgi:hypothetical protein